MLVLFEYEETQKELDARRAQAARIGEELRVLGDLLQYNPDRVFFSGDSVPVEYRTVPAPDPDLLNIAKIREIATAMRELNRKLEGLSERRQRLGYK
jgi:hypothetical protein